MKRQNNSRNITKYWLVDWENYEDRIVNQDMLMLMVKSQSPVCCGCALWLLQNCCYRPTGSSSLEYSPSVFV